MSHSRRAHLKSLAGLAALPFLDQAARQADPPVPRQGIGRRIRHVSYSDLGGRPDSVQIMLAPPGSDMLNLMINADPDILRDLEKALKIRQREAAEEERRRELNRVKFDTNMNATVEAN